MNWADNIFLLAENEFVLSIMVADLTDVIYAHRLRWKLSSLEVMAGGCLRGRKIFMKARTAEGLTIQYKQVDEMIILGNLIDAEGSTESSVDYRLEQAEKSFWLNARTLTGPGAACSKLKAWSGAQHAVALFGSRTWHLSKQTFEN